MYKARIIVLWFCFFVFSASAYAQSYSYSVAISHVQKISSESPEYKDVFRKFTIKLPSEIRVFYTIHIKVYQEKKNQHSILIYFQEDSVIGNRYYRQLTLGDLFFPKRIFLNGYLFTNDTNVFDIKIQNRQIFENQTLIDTIITTPCDTLLWNHKIEYIQFYFDEQLSEKLEERIKKIDSYHQNDSLFLHWHKELDKLKLSNIDLLPIYKFTLQDIEDEASKYIDNQFENLLTISKLDNSEYLRKISTLFYRIRTVKNHLSVYLPLMDSLLYEKGWEFEKQENYERAVYYYKRSLDYNPNHIQSTLALSNFHTLQKQYDKSIELISNLYKDTSLQIENHDVAHQLYQILFSIAENKIKNGDHYTALKTLDTLEYFYEVMPDSFFEPKHKTLRYEAKQGVYNAYLDVIRQAIYNSKYELAVNYIQGLKNLMLKNDDMPEEQTAYQKILGELWSEFLEKTYKHIRQKKYIYALIEAKEVNNALDSGKILYADSIFNEIYEICYTNLFAEKKAEICKMKQHKQTTKLVEKLKEIDDFYDHNKEYIRKNINMDEECSELKTLKHYGSLCRYISTYSTDISDYNFLDSCALCYKWQQEYQFDTCVSWKDVIENKCVPIFLAGFSRVNIYSWGNEFKKAIPLYNQLTQSFHNLDLQENNALKYKYLEVKSLIESRGCIYLENEKRELYHHVQTLFAQKKHLKTEEIIQNRNNLYLNCQSSSYDDSISYMLKINEKPAYFQKLYNLALEKLSLSDYAEGFSLYEEAYEYFASQSIENYGLICLNRKEFLISQKNKDYYTYTCKEYIEKNELDKAMDIMLLAVSQEVNVDETQQQLGTLYAQYVDEKKLNPYKTIKPYSLSQEHTVFLNSFLGKFKAFLYTILH